jgi:predicted HicB family RNase H-like nuclease
MWSEKDRYTYRVIWSEEDSEYAGLCEEFPSLSWLAETPEKAFKGIKSVVEEVLADMRKTGEKFPEPVAVTGSNFPVYIPEEIHRNLIAEATEAGISLNRLIAEKLSKPLHI